MRAILLMGLLAQFLISCDWAAKVDEMYWSIYEYKNASGKDIKLMVFEHGKFMNIELLNTKIYKDSAESMGVMPNKLISRADSILVTYNNERQHKFYKRTDDISDRNPIFGNSYKIIFLSNYKRISEFTFTPQDYENATPCNGKCN